MTGDFLKEMQEARENKKRQEWLKKVEPMWNEMDKEVLKRITGCDEPVDFATASADSIWFHYGIKAVLKRVLPLLNIGNKLDYYFDDTRIIRHNTRVLKAIFMDYLQHEKQAHRREMLEQVIKFILVLEDMDENYTELFDWFLLEVIKNADKFRFNSSYINPDTWFQDGRGRLIQPAFNCKLVNMAGALVPDREVDGDGKNRNDSN